MVGLEQGSQEIAVAPWAMVIGAVAACLVAATVIGLAPHGVMIVAVGVLLAALVAAAWKPWTAVVVLLVGLPVHSALMALLYHATGSASFVKLMQPWKEAVIAVAIVSAAFAGVRGWRRGSRLRFTVLDGMIVAIMLIAAFWIVVPGHGAQVSLANRFIAFRDIMLPFGAYALGRLLNPSRRVFAVIVGALAAETLIFGVAAIGERGVWGLGPYFAVGFSAYLQHFLGQTFQTLNNVPYTFYTQDWYPRAGSLMFGPLDLSEFAMVVLPILLAVFGVLYARRERGRSWLLGAALFIGGAAFVLAWGRASLVLLIPVLLIVAWFARLRRVWPAVLALGLGMAFGTGLLFAVVSILAAQANITQRALMAQEGLLPMLHGALPSLNGLNIIQASANANNDSTWGHINAVIKIGIYLLRHPGGIGLGTAGLAAAHSGFAIDDEDSYLVVGVQIGLVGGILYLGVFLTAIVSCYRAARARLDPLRHAIFLGVAFAWPIIFLNGFIAQVTSNLFIMFALWLLTGMAARVVEESRVQQVGWTASGRGAEMAWEATRPLKIAMDANCLRTARTGVRTYADELIARFTRPDAPHRVVVLRGPARLPSAVRPFRIINQAVYLLWLHIWLPLRLWAGCYDVLFSPEYLTPVFAPVATVVTFHDALFLRRPQDYNRLWLAMFRRVTLPAIRRADAVLVPSTYTARETTDFGGIDPERIYVVPQGGPTHGEALTTDTRMVHETLARFGLQPRQYVLHVGVLERRKNLPMLIRAFAAWRAHGEPGQRMKLVLVGQRGPRPDLDDARTISETARALGLEDAVVLTGHVSAEERDALYQAAAMVAVPSTFEGFGIPVLEAFAARVPVLCSRATSLPEVAGDAALLFDPSSPDAIAAAMDRIARDGVLRETLVRAGVERLRLFTWERTAAGTFAAAEEAVVHRYAPRGARPQGSAFALASEPVPSPAGRASRAGE